MAEAQNPKKFWKLLYFLFIMSSVYTAIAGTITLIDGGNVAMGITSIITSCVAFVLTVKLFD